MNTSDTIVGGESNMFDEVQARELFPFEIAEIYKETFLISKCFQRNKTDLDYYILLICLPFLSTAFLGLFSIYLFVIEETNSQKTTEK